MKTIETAKNKNYVLPCILVKTSTSLPGHFLIAWFLYKDTKSQTSDFLSSVSSLLLIQIQINRNVRKRTLRHVNPTKAQISRYIRVFVVRMKKLCILGYPKCAQRRFWSDCANAQTDLNLRWAHMSEGTFPDVAAQILMHHKSIHSNVGTLMYYIIWFHLINWNQCYINNCQSCKLARWPRLYLGYLDYC